MKRLMQRLTQRLAALLLTTPLALAAPAEAQQAKGCFTKPEQAAEQIVRFGLRLREGARLCAADPYRMDSWTLWTQIDQRLGSQFAAQTALRRKAFQREFPDTSEGRLSLTDGRIVMYYRSQSPSPVFCADLRNLLQDVLKSGWGALTKKAAKARDQVELDYDPC